MEGVRKSCDITASLDSIPQDFQLFPHICQGSRIPDPHFPPGCTHISQADLRHSVCSGWLWLMSHTELSHSLGTAGLLGHTGSLCGMSVLADRVWHLQSRHSQSLLAWGSLPGSRSHGEMQNCLQLCVGRSMPSDVPRVRKLYTDI